MKGRSFVKACFLIGWLSAFIGYIGPQLNQSILNPALPEQVKYILDFVFLGVTMVLIYYGMAGEKKMDERQVQEIRDAVREEERGKLLLEMRNNPMQPTDSSPPPNALFGTNRIKVLFSGKAKVKLSALEDVEDMEIVIPEKAITPQPEESLTDEIDELLKEPAQ